MFHFSSRSAHGMSAECLCYPAVLPAIWHDVHSSPKAQRRITSAQSLTQYTAQPS